jgi:MFS family permease
MSTTTPNPDTQAADRDSVRATTGSTIQGWLLIVLVFVAGAASLAVELSASRLLAPYFGTSLFVWANLIGLILLYLTIGYYVGGLVADRHPRPDLLYLLITVAAFLIGLIPFISRPILSWSLSALRALPAVDLVYRSAGHAHEQGAPGASAPAETYPAQHSLDTPGLCCVRPAGANKTPQRWAISRPTSAI